jgi:hypothetical protein
MPDEEDDGRIYQCPPLPQVKEPEWIQTPAIDIGDFCISCISQTHFVLCPWLRYTLISPV